MEVEVFEDQQTNQMATTTAFSTDKQRTDEKSSTKSFVLRSAKLNPINRNQRVIKL